MYGMQWRLFVNVLEEGDEMHVGHYWKPGGCTSDQTIVRLNVDTGVVWCFLISLAVTADIYITSLVFYEVLCISIRLTGLEASVQYDNSLQTKITVS